MAFQYCFVLGFEAIGAANRGLIWYQSVCQVSAQKKDICFPLQQPLDVQLSWWVFKRAAPGRFSWFPA